MPATLLPARIQVLRIAAMNAAEEMGKRVGPVGYDEPVDIVSRQGTRRLRPLNALAIRWRVPQSRPRFPAAFSIRRSGSTSGRQVAGVRGLERPSPWESTLEQTGR